MPKSSEQDGRKAEDIPLRRPPAQSPDRRAAQLAILAQDLLEERILKGTASPTEMTAALNMGSPTTAANLKRIEAQTAYLEAQRLKAEAETLKDELFQKAIDAMNRYDPPSDT